MRGPNMYEKMGWYPIQKASGVIKRTKSKSGTLSTFILCIINGGVLRACDRGDCKPCRILRTGATAIIVLLPSQSRKAPGGIWEYYNSQGLQAQWRVKTWLSMGTETALLELAPCSLSSSERTPLLFKSKTLN